MAAIPRLAAAVSNAGALGMVTLTWSADPGAVVRETAALTARPFGGNFVLTEDHHRRLDQALEAGLRVVSFMWGDPSGYIEPVHDAGGVVMHTVGSAEEARRAVASGVDVVVAQGWEAGGHVWGRVATLPLVPAVVDAVAPVPVIAAGGIGDARGVAAVLALGAQAAWLGTRFLMAEEMPIHEDYRRRLIAAAETDPQLYANLYEVGWPDAAGFELFSGVNVPSKAFGEHVEHSYNTPSVSAEELHALIEKGTDMVVLDSRPFDEYQRVSIPTATNVPGAELVLRVHDLAPSPETLVVVNCAGRTRSILGAQSLINAGIPNKVVALRNGTMGWSLAGFACEKDKQKRAPKVSGKSLAWAKSAAEQVAQPIWNRASRSRHAQSLACRRSRAHALCLRRARSGGIRSRPRRGRDFRAGRPTGAGDRSICRNAWRAHRAGRRFRGARGDDRVLAAPDGLEGCLCAGAGRNRKGLAGLSDLRHAAARRKARSIAQVF